MVIKVGIFFGGASREREISFAGGRTVYDQLDRTLFEPIPIFVDSLGNFILLDWKYLYHGTIREFYPSVASIFGIPLYIESLAELSSAPQAQLIAGIGKKIEPSVFSQYFDIAFLCLHGPYGEDGTIQALLEWYHMPYTGSGILPSALGIDKIFQKKLLHQAGFLLPPSLTLTQQDWLHAPNKQLIFDQAIEAVGLPFVVKSSRQGSSIGVNIVHNKELAFFIEAINQSFFIEELSYSRWANYHLEDKKSWLHKLTDVREGIGFPLYIAEELFYTPNQLIDYIEAYFQQKKKPLLLISSAAEQAILIESFIKGREFSCVVLEVAAGKPMALPPTEMLKGEFRFDYRAKYLPGIVRKVTPMALAPLLLKTIQQQVVELFQLLNGQVYARIDGFVTEDNQILLNDPNTTAGMNPSSFLFHQAAEIGWNPTQLLTFIIQRSLAVRAAAYKGNGRASWLLETLSSGI
ncbi:MAG: hypothetical protein K2X94_02890 [Amoebophilaceae bacterium]|nr:hypothetical protein [Amoebophilaceae bacterium]